MVAGLGTNTANDVVQALLVQREASSKLLVIEVEVLGPDSPGMSSTPPGRAAGGSDPSEMRGGL